MSEMKTLTINGKKYTVTDPDAAMIDDPVVGQAAWSGKNIVDRLCPAFSESGAAVACEPVAGYPLEVVSHIRPVQAGSGNPSPSNIRPITGHTAMKLSLSNDAQVQEFTLDLGQTVYGGSLNWRTGVLTVDMTTYQITSVDNVSYDGGYARMPLTTSVPPERRTEAVCSNLRYVQSTSTNDGFWIDGAGTGLRIRIADFTTKEEYKNWIQENSPVFVFPTDPITVQLTPQEILALSGTNTLYSDTGDTTVTGRADPQAVIEDLYDKINQLLANAVNNA